MSYYKGIFLVGAHLFGVPFSKLQTFSGIFWVLPIEYNLYNKTGNLCLSVYLQSYNIKSRSSNSAVKLQHVLLVNEPF